MPDRALTITLDPPIEHDGGTISALTVREPTGAQMRDAEKKLDAGLTAESASNYEAALIGAVSGIAPAALDKLPVSVMRQAGFRGRVRRRERRRKD